MHEEATVQNMPLEALAVSLLLHSSRRRCRRRPTTVRRCFAAFALKATAFFLCMRRTPNHLFPPNPRPPLHAAAPAPLTARRPAVRAAAASGEVTQSAKKRKGKQADGGKDGKGATAGKDGKSASASISTHLGDDWDDEDDEGEEAFLVRCCWGLGGGLGGQLVARQQLGV